MPKSERKPDCFIVLMHFLTEANAARGEVSEIRPELQVRLDEAVRRWKDDPLLFIILNGGKTKGTTRSQGRACYEYLCEHGVYRGNIFWTERGHDTFEELNLARETMRDQNWCMPGVVSNPLQLKQVEVVFRKLGVPWKRVPTELQDTSAVYARDRRIAVWIAHLDPHGRSMGLLRWARAHLFGQLQSG